MFVEFTHINNNGKYESSSRIKSNYIHVISINIASQHRHYKLAETLVFDYFFDCGTVCAINKCKQ